MSLSFEIVRREDAARLETLAPLFPLRAVHRPEPPPWSVPKDPAPASEPEGPAPVPDEEAPARPEEAVPPAPEPQAEPGPALQEAAEQPAPAPEPDPEVLEQARAAARTEGFEEAYARGLEEGRKQAEADKHSALEEASRNLARSIAALESTQQQLVDAAEQALAELALAIAERLVRQQINAAPALLLKVIDDALRTAPQAGTIRLALHPVDLSVAEPELRARGTERGAKDRRLELVPNPALERGDLVVTTELGTIDGRIRSQIERIRQGFDAESFPALEIFDDLPL
jgi:flagellar assembly protein FliH